MLINIRILFTESFGCGVDIDISEIEHAAHGVICEKILFAKCDDVLSDALAAKLQEAGGLRVSERVHRAHLVDTH